MHTHTPITHKVLHFPFKTHGAKLQANEAIVGGLPLTLWTVWGICLRAIKIHSHLTAKRSSLLKRTPLCACWHSRALYGAGSLFSMYVCWHCGGIAGPVHYSLGIYWHWGALLRCIHYFLLGTAQTCLFEDQKLTSNDKLAFLPEEKGVYFIRDLI